jgi:hypothetical protein
MTSQFATREEWLAAATSHLSVKFAEANRPLPEKIRFAIGFTSKGAKGKRIGECWQSVASADSHYEIFITPTLSDPVRILDVLVHELCHAALPIGAGHGPSFRALATRLGLTGRMTATVASPALEAELGLLVHEKLGPLPHGELRADRAVGAPKAQKNRWLKASCPHCDYTVRITRTHAESLGAVCPEHGQMEIEGL